MKLHLIVLDNIKTALDGIVAWVIWLGSSLMQHYSDVIMSRMASQITSLTIVYSTIYSGADQRKHQSSASPAFVRGVHRWLVNSPHKWPVTQNMFPFDDVITSNLAWFFFDAQNWNLAVNYSMYLKREPATKFPNLLFKPKSCGFKDIM